MKLYYILTILIFGLFFSGCVKIQTGQTAEEAAQSSEQRAKQIRGDWANRISQVSPPEMAQLLGDLCGKVISIIYDYGQQTAQRWDEGQKGRNEDISSDEMRKMVDQWLARERPILKAYEDNLEYALQQIQLSNQFDDMFINNIKSLLDMYYEVYTTNLIPQGNLDDFLYEIERIKTESDELLESYYYELNRY